MGELLKEIPESKRSKKAKSMGVPAITANRAVKIQDIPKDKRDELIEASPPIGYLALVDRSCKYRNEVAPDRTWDRHMEPETPLDKAMEFLRDVDEINKGLGNDGAYVSLLTESGYRGMSVMRMIEAIGPQDSTYARRVLSEAIENLAFILDCLPQDEGE